MKICWDNINKIVRYDSLNNHFVIKGSSVTYVYKENCKNCGEPFLDQKHNNGNFCSLSCFCAGKTNPFYGKDHSEEFKKKNSERAKKQVGEQNPFYKKKHTEQSKAKMSYIRKGKSYGEIFGTDKANKVLEKRTLTNVKNEIRKKGNKNTPRYNFYSEKLTPIEQVRCSKDNVSIEVKCTYCGTWFIPTRDQINLRICDFNYVGVEHRFYCSNKCKTECPIFGQHKYLKNYKKASAVEVDPYLRQMVFERDNWTCQKCEKHKNELETGLHCHHIDPAAQNPMFQNDMDSCIALCKECHKQVHSQPGCKYHELKRCFDKYGKKQYKIENQKKNHYE